MDLVPFPQDKEKWRGGGSSEHGDELSPFIKFEYIFFLFTIWENISISRKSMLHGVN